MNEIKLDWRVTFAVIFKHTVIRVQQLSFSTNPPKMFDKTKIADEHSFRLSFKTSRSRNTKVTLINSFSAV